VCTPEYLEQEARNLVKAYPNHFEIEVLGETQLQEKGLNLLYSVGKGARVPPRLVIVRYKGKPNDNNNPIAIVGKGITFDTGGLDLKTPESMLNMYLDMSGSATVLGVLSILPKLNIKKNIVGALCLAENAIGSKAYHPSTIIRSYKGLTVEIGNTDAEGRLVLADGFTYLQRHYKPETIVDLATLTGACIVALGEYSAGIFSNDERLSTSLYQSGENTFERLWKLPIYEEHIQEITKNDHSDLKNIGKGRYGGASTAAAFLQQFIETGVKWAHIDIAGPAMYSEKRGHMPKGGTGFGCQLLIDWIMKHK